MLRLCNVVGVNAVEEQICDTSSGDVLSSVSISRNHVSLSHVFADSGECVYVIAEQVACQQMH